MVDVILASTLDEGSVSFLYYADRVSQLPLAVVGIAVGVALLPLLTNQLRAGETAAALTARTARSSSPLRSACRRRRR